MKMKNQLKSGAFTWTLIALLTMAVLLNLFQADRVHALETQVSASYQKAFFETVTLIDSIGMNLEKLMISLAGSGEAYAAGMRQCADNVGTSGVSVQKLTIGEGTHIGVGVDTHNLIGILTEQTVAVTLNGENIALAACEGDQIVTGFFCGLESTEEFFSV